MKKISLTIMLFGLLVGGGTIGCAQSSNPDTTLASVAVEPLSEAQQNLLRCELNPILLTLPTSAERQQFVRGCRLYFTETFGGNDRTCGTCHLQTLGNGNPLDNNFDFGPADAQALFLTDPGHSFFRSIDSDDGASDFTTLLAHGLVRISFVLPPNITVREPNARNVQHNSDGTTTVFVWRSTPSSENTFFEENLMWDGRELSDLAAQSISAVETHYEPSRFPTTQEAEDMAFFQEQLFTNFSIRTWAAGGSAPGLPQVPEHLTGDHWTSVRRGRNFFVSMPVVPDAPVRGGHCATCHSGSLLNRTNEFNPVQPPGDFFTNNFVSETNSPTPVFPPGTRVGNNLPELTYDIVLTYDFVMPPGVPIPGLPPAGTLLFPAGSVFTMRSSDPGRVLITGDPCEAPLACLINSDPMTGRLGTVSFFRISSLWGSADSGPYFHDNSAATLEDVLAVYRTVFLATALGTGNSAWILSPQEELDIVHYMNFAFYHHPALLP